jgi:HAD superfamily hydrolase (TIGR01493 family)
VVIDSGADIMSDMAAKFSGVLLDFAGTLFDQEDEGETLRAIGVVAPEAAGVALALSRADELAAAPALMPPGLARQWERRDLTAEAHRAAYAELLREAGLPSRVADAFYARACSPEAWYPFDDTVSCLRSLRARQVPVAVVSNIGWDLRPVFDRHGVLSLVDAFVLSYEHGAMKPEPRLFTAACDALGVAPGEALMVGDSVDSDGGATAIGCTFSHLGPPRAPDALRSALAPVIGE